MKVIEIIKQCAELNGLTQELDLLETITEENEEETRTPEIITLLNLIKFSLQELCTNYLPVITKEEVQTTNLKYELYKLKNFIRVQNVYKNGSLINFKIINRSILVEEDGVYEIEYAVYPEITSLFQEIDFLSNFNPDVVVLGLAAYYTLAHGRFEEFKIYHEQYLEKAESLKELKTFNMPQRRWQ